jgi:hypothetical protein
MPRDTDKRVYLTVAINRDSRLMRQLQEDERQKGVPKSHLLAFYADEYIRLFLNGEISQSPTQNTLPMAKISASNQQNEVLISSGISDDDLDFYDD